jgi:hypothetical protein
MDKKYIEFIKELKQNIIQSRFIATRLANKEQLLLYYNTGRMLSEKIEFEKWGTVASPLLTLPAPEKGAISEVALILYFYKTRIPCLILPTSRTAGALEAIYKGPVLRKFGPSLPKGFFICKYKPSRCLTVRYGITKNKIFCH